jgi:hypothetical protein
VPALAPLPRLRPAAVEIDAAGDVVAWLEIGRRLGGVRLAWRFEELRVATGVELAACFANARLPVRLLFLLGGRARIERRLDAALAELTEIARITGAARSGVISEPRDIPGQRGADEDAPGHEDEQRDIAAAEQ